MSLLQYYKSINFAVKSSKHNCLTCICTVKVLRELDVKINATVTVCAVMMWLEVGVRLAQRCLKQGSKSVYSPTLVDRNYLRLA